MYTRDSIDKVREADIVTTIEAYLQDLKKSGANLKAKSPFVDEKSPSFMVSPVKQIFKDFASGIGGDGIKFVMEHDKYDFIEAVEKVASIHNIFLDKETLAPEAKRVQKQKSDLIALVTNVGSQYRKNFVALKASDWAKQMIKGREFSEETIIDFQIGYAPNDNQVTTAVSASGILAPSIEVGIVNSGAHGSYDTFRNRLIFPIHNAKGTLIAFGGRRENGAAFEKYPKYINSKESAIYTKSDVLYGLYQAKTAIRKSGWVILTEGYTDVIGMFDKGAENTVATCGTALTQAHVKELHKYCEHIVLFRDGDRAGLEASKRDIDICLAEGFKVSICMLQDGKDPDDFARENPNPQEWVFQNKQDALIWHTEIIMKEFERDNYQFELDQINEAAKIEIKALESNKQKLVKLKGDEKKQATKYNKSLDTEIIGINKQAAKDCKEVERIDPWKKDQGVDKVVRSLVLIKKEVQLKEYTSQLAKLLSVPVKTLTLSVANLFKAQKERAQKSKKKDEKPAGFPEGANLEQYFEDRFCEIGNQYHFETKNNFFIGTNFKITPLYHIKGRKENKRLCEITNTNNKKAIIDLDSESFVSYGDFRRQLIKEGFYIFLSGTNTLHFDLVAQKVLKEFNTALELQTMGWNAKGFFAFANGVYWKDQFRNVNNYGIVYLEGVDKDVEDDGYNEDVEYFYSPSNSVMHKRNQDGDDPYENDRKFVYKQAAISLDQWMAQMITVFDDKGMMGIVFNFASLFRDLFLKSVDYFPLLGGFGEKDSGKSGFGKMLQNFFFYNEEPLELNQATLVALTRRLSRTTNTVTFLDEHNNRLDEKILQALKGVWNGLGREKGIATTDKRTIVDKINQAVYYAGQYLPTSDDNALQTRTICLQFPSRNYSPQEKEEFNKLISWTTQGISSLVIDILNHREHFKTNMNRVYNEVIREMKADLVDQEYQERIADNISVMLISYKLLANKIKFPFTYEAFKKYALELLIENSNSVSDSNGLTEFWQIVQFLRESNVIRDTEHFKIAKPVSLTLEVGKNGKKKYENPNREKQLLYLRLNTAHQFYTREVTRREGSDVIGETTIRNYFKSRPYFIGRSSQRFATGTYSCFVFDYSMMQKMRIVTMHEDREVPLAKTNKEVTTTPKSSDEDDLPF